MWFLLQKEAEEALAEYIQTEIHEDFFPEVVDKDFLPLVFDKFLRDLDKKLSKKREYTKTRPF